MLAPHTRLRTLVIAFHKYSGYDGMVMSATDDSPSNVAEPRRIRLPRSGILLGCTLLLIVVFVGVWTLLAGQRQRALIQHIEERGGTVESTQREPEWLRDWLVKALGEEQTEGFDWIVSLDLRSTEFSDDDCEQLRRLTALRELDLRGLYVGDNGLQHLSGHDNLQFLDVSHTSVSDAGLAHLSGLKGLVDLRLSFTRVTDVGLRHLASVTTLERIDIRGTQVTDEGVEELRKQLPNCEITY